MKLDQKIEFSGKPKQLDILLFTRHLSTMVKSGIPIADALGTLSEQTKSSRFKKIIETILADIQNGQSLAKALAKHPDAFDQFYVHLIEVSEQSGSLEENLEFIAKELAKSYALQNKIKSALLYPGLLLFAATVMAGFIAFFVLPQLVDFFSAFDTDLPLATKILLFIARIMKDYGILIIIFLFAFTSLFQVTIRTPTIKPLWHAFVLKIPLIGTFIANSQLAQFTRNFGILIKSGVPISKSLDVTAETLSNEIFKRDIRKIGASLKQGKRISEAIQKGHYFEFPPLVIKMVEVGEKTGKLDESLLYLGDFFEEEIDNVSKNLTTIIEPVLLIGIGLIVGFLALAIITPIYDLTGTLR